MPALMVPGASPDADRAAATALARIVAACAGDYLTAARATRRRASVPNVHSLRVCTRRLRAALGLCSGSVPRDLLRPLRRALRRPFRRAGRLRDLHVAGRLLRRYRDASGSVAAALAAIARERPRRARRLHAALSERRIRRVTARLAAVTDALQSRTRSAPAARGTVAALARQLEGLQAALGRAATAAVRTPEPEPLHQARIALKRLRYSLELVEAAPGMPPGPDLRDLRDLQRQLGQVADLTMAARFAPADLARELDATRRAAVRAALPALAARQEEAFA
jgi:CHAD domain-containing protein